MSTKDRAASARAPTRIGILGGGQLARMLLQAAAHLPDLEVCVLAASRLEPAAAFAIAAGNEDALVLGDPRDPAALARFARPCDVLTFESEFQPAAELEHALGPLARRFRPSLAALAVTQDKLQQKALCERLALPTAPYRALPEQITDAADVMRLLADERASLGDDPVLKWARFGYDGKGTLFYHPAVDRRLLQRFVDQARQAGSAIFAERRVAFVRELAVQAVFATHGEFCCYPLVISEQQDGICKRVIGPAIALGVDNAHQERAWTFAGRIARELVLHGTFAIELFESCDGQLLINEMAPRVHNSGHYTIDAAGCSQFENHLRAIAGLPLGSVETSAAFGMLNLIGERAQPAVAPQVRGPGILHWYEKRESRSGRKLGHLNVGVGRVEQLAAAMTSLQAQEQTWLEAQRAAASQQKG